MFGVAGIIVGESSECRVVRRWMGLGLFAV